ncbi:MAG: bifunctional metallophosphatase/5'-nucleotidase [bacterium]
MLSKTFKFSVFLTVGFAFTSCFDNSYGGAFVSSDIPQKIVIIHSTDTHAKYFPFWMEPNMFDRDMGLISNNRACWDLDGDGFCNGAYNKETGLYQVWESGKYSYYTKKELSQNPSLVIEDINEDGVCDILDCQRCWDLNKNNICDDDEDVDGVSGCSLSDCKAQMHIKKIAFCWDLNGNGECDEEEDINFDNICGFDDCALVYDKNHNGTCDFPFDTMSNTWLDENGKPILRENFSSESDYNIAITNAEQNSEDINRDGVCNYADYRPGLVNAGGVARVKTVTDKIRKSHQGVPVIHLDSGDAFQGAPQFNLYKGELEMKAIQKLGIDAMAIGNHEFDNGTAALVAAYRKSEGFPLLASNYLFDWDGHKGLMDITSPYIILTRGALKIGIIGVGNDSSLTSIYHIGGSIGFNVVDPIESAQTYVNVVAPLVDLVIILSHQGLEGDYEIAEKVKGVDLVLGGHHHVVLNPVKIVEGEDGRDVLVVHSGVNYKVLGELEVAVQNRRVVWHNYKTHIVNEAVQEDGNMVDLLKPYLQGLEYSQYLKRIVGRTSSTIARNDPSGGDSPLGNIVTDAMMNHELSRAQFCVTNSMGIRADIPTGEITLEKLYEVFPFENSITTMYLSGKELKTFFDFVARRSATRGCKTQIQAAGLGVELDCNPKEKLQKEHGSYALTKCLTIGGVEIIKDYELVLPHMLFKMATNDYMGKGGSGFYMLEYNTTRLDTSVSLRDAVSDFLSEQGEINPLDYSLNQTGVSECGGGKRIKMIN